MYQNKHNMGEKLNSLFLRKKSKTSKLESLANIAIARLAILKNQHYVRFSHARDDVIQLLNHGNQSSALLRVEYVIKELNMIDAFVMIQCYCTLLIDCVQLIQNIRECPDKLKETISSLIFAASRCGEFPELQRIRENLASQFGKEFEACAVELKNNCRVNPEMIQKLSTQQVSMESRQKLLLEIASENGIPLHSEDEQISDLMDVAAAEQKALHESESSDEEMTENSNIIHLKQMKLIDNGDGQERTLSPLKFESNGNDETVKKPLNN